MVKLAKLAGVSLMALWINGLNGAEAASEQPQVQVLRDDGRLVAMYDEMVVAVSEATPSSGVVLVAPDQAAESASLTVRFVTRRFTDQVLSGHLAWRDREGRTGAGPDIDLTVMDATISDKMLRDYARQLVSFSNLPL